MSAPFETCTNSWSIMEDIMLDYSFREDVAMAGKFHPDKVSHLGKEFQEMAEEKFKAISEAYEQIKDERGMA